MGPYKKNKPSMWSSRLRGSMPGFILLPTIKMSRKSVDGPNTKVKKGNLHTIRQTL